MEIVAVEVGDGRKVTLRMRGMPAKIGQCVVYIGGYAQDPLHIFFPDMIVFEAAKDARGKIYVAIEPADGGEELTAESPTEYTGPEGDETEDKKPVVVSISPTSAGIGQRVTLTGQYLGKVQSVGLWSQVGVIVAQNRTIADDSIAFSVPNRADFDIKGDYPVVIGIEGSYVRTNKTLTVTGQ